eukprot:Nk52_evm9s1401 gene=Nk52_evmTU9s1401
MFGSSAAGNNENQRTIKTFGKKKTSNTIYKDNWDAIVNAPRKFTSWLGNVLTPARNNTRSPLSGIENHPENDIQKDTPESNATSSSVADTSTSSSYSASTTDNDFGGWKDSACLKKRFHSVIASPFSVQSKKRIQNIEDLNGSFLGKADSSLADDHELENVIDSVVNLTLSECDLKNHGDAMTCLKRICDQDQIFDMRNAIADYFEGDIKKIGEGSYGEVFSMVFGKEQTAVKIVPIDGKRLINGEPQMTLEQVIPEAVISKKLNELHYQQGVEMPNCTESFILVHKMILCHGPYPDCLIEEWDKFDECRGSENERPDFFSSEQLFIVFVFANGGKDLENFHLKSAEQATSILLQASLALSVAEEAYEFEHRDLHWGNILISVCDEDSEVTFTLRGKKYALVSAGVKISIIDYSLSRMNSEGDIIYFNLEEDESIFEGKGDCQFDVYRAMRRVCDSGWEHHHPETNILWIDYLAQKLLKDKKVRSNSKFRKELSKFRRNLKNYHAIPEALEDSFFATLLL